MGLKAIIKTVDLGENSSTTVLGIGYDERALWGEIYRDDNYTFPSMYGEPAIQCEFVVSVSTDHTYTVIVREVNYPDAIGAITYEIVDTHIVSSKFGS